MPNVGEVLGFHTKNVIGKDSAYKWHFCICSHNRLYLYVCGREYPGDFPITKQNCPGLSHDVSYLSLSRLIHVPDDKMRNAKAACTADEQFVRALWDHVIDSKVISDKDRNTIIQGFERHLGKRK